MHKFSELPKRAGWWVSFAHQPDQLPTLAADLVGRQVAVIVATGGDNAVLAAKAATRTIPIIFTYGGDPVRRGLVTSLSRPDGNVTGISFFSSVLSAKGFGLLHDIVPDATVVAFLLNPSDPESVHTLSDAREAARELSPWAPFTATEPC